MQLHKPCSTDIQDSVNTENTINSIRMVYFLPILSITKTVIIKPVEKRQKKN